MYSAIAGDYQNYNNIVSSIMLEVFNIKAYLTLFVFICIYRDYNNVVSHKFSDPDIDRVYEPACYCQTFYFLLFSNI